MSHSLSHSKWLCKYHIIFTPKYRRKIIYNKYRESIRDIIKSLCSYKGIEILEGHLMPDHVHFWSIGYYVSTVGLNEATIRKYIQDQEKEDILHDKLGIKEYDDPFKG